MQVRRTRPRTCVRPGADAPARMVSAARRREKVGEGGREGGRGGGSWQRRCVEGRKGGWCRGRGRAEGLRWGRESSEAGKRLFF